MADCQINSRLLEKVTDIYEWLETQIQGDVKLAGRCNSCGKCCDFAGSGRDCERGFDHLLFVTPPELMYLVANLGAENIKRMPSGLCPYNIEGKCTIYDYRFAGCRIFCCNADTDFQSRLSESVSQKLKSLCVEFQIPYNYADLATVLNSFAGA